MAEAESSCLRSARKRDWCSQWVERGQPVRGTTQGCSHHPSIPLWSLCPLRGYACRSELGVGGGWVAVGIKPKPTATARSLHPLGLYEGIWEGFNQIVALGCVLKDQVEFALQLQAGTTNDSPGGGNCTRHFPGDGEEPRVFRKLHVTPR